MNNYEALEARANGTNKKKKSNPNYDQKRFT